MGFQDSLSTIRLLREISRWRGTDEEGPKKVKGNRRTMETTRESEREPGLRDRERRALGDRPDLRIYREFTWLIENRLCNE